MQIPLPAYDPQNLFARILRGEIPCHRVYEDGEVLAFMDIMPLVDGHVLVVPKAEARNAFDCDPAVYGALFGAAQRIAQAVCTAFDAPGLTVQQHNEAAGGQEVFHIHVHVLPRQEGVPLRPRAMATPEVLAAHAARIRAVLESA